MNFKPTNKEPISDQSKSFEKNFKSTMNQNNLQLNEIDDLLTEKEQSLKKKIFSLPKMESLVFSEPILTSVYDEMAEDGEEKYGYHYNETIMNIIFNDYVLNSPKYLQKYKMARPKKKKRRDKSEINQLKKSLTTNDSNEKKSVDENINDIVSVKFLVNDSDPKNNDVFAYFPELNYDSSGKYKTAYSHIGQHSACHPEYARESRLAKPEEYMELKKELEDIGYKLNIQEAFSKTGKPAAQKPQVHGGKVLDTGAGDGISETSTTGSVGGSGMGSGGYSTPKAWSTKGDLMGGEKNNNVKRKPIWHGGTIIQESNYLIDPIGFEKYINELNEQIDYINKHSDGYGDLENMNKTNLNIIKKDIQTGKMDEPNFSLYEHHLETRDEKIAFILSNSKYNETQLNNFDDKKIDKIYQIIEKKMGLSEVAKSKSQQRLFGIAHAAQKGDIPMSKLGGAAKKIAKTVSPNDVEDFASTKHDKLPEKVDEHHLTDRESKIKFIISADAKLNPQDPPTGMEETYWRKILKNLNDENIDIIYNNMENLLKQSGIDPLNINETDQSMIDSNPQTMANKPQSVGDLGTNVEMGTQSSGGLRENIIRENNKEDMSDKLFEELENELNAYSIHQEKLQKIVEDRKPSALVLKDSLGSDNVKNFKSDMKNSNTGNVIDVEKEMQWKEQQTEVGDNPQKLNQDIEKQVLKNTKGNALENVGDSANNKGDEVPKRNLTTEEQDEVDMYRLGQQDLVYDNKPSERFEERMKADMGDRLYDQRQKKLEFRGKAPMYNKDPQPIEDTTSDKVQFNKEQTGWNERTGLKESMITGRYKDVLNKNKIIDFMLENVVIVESIDENLHKLDFTGLGNSLLSKSVNNKVIVNEEVVGVINSHNFYTNGKEVFAIKIAPKLINEGCENNEDNNLNESLVRLKHLSSYKPKNFIDTKNIKKSRGF